MKVKVRYVGHFNFIEVRKVQPLWLRTLGKGWNVVVKL